MPDDADTGELRELAVASLVRGAERAARTGAPDRASRSYAEAAALVEEAGTDAPQAGLLLERAAQQAHASGDATLALTLSESALARAEALSDERAIARTRTLVGRGHSRLSRYTEARQSLREAIVVLSRDPGVDTVEAMSYLATVEMFSGTPEADAATVESLKLAQALGLGPGTMSGVVQVRGTYLARVDRLDEAVFHLREAVRLAEQAERLDILGVVLGNLGAILMARDTAAATEVIRRGIAVSRRTGDRRTLGVGIINLSLALLELGEWDEVDQLIAPGGDLDSLPDSLEFGRWGQALLAALRGDVTASARILSELTYMPGSDDPEDQSAVALLEALVAAADGRPDDALADARRALSYGELLGLGHEVMRYGWPLATRIAHDQHDDVALDDLLAQLPEGLPGLVPPVLRAERLLVLARREAARHEPAAGAAFAGAIAATRDSSPPHLLAHALLDHAAYLAAHGDPAGAAAAIDEAREIGERLGCRPVLARVDALTGVPREQPAPH